MGEHRWRWDGPPDGFPYHDLRNVEGERVVDVEPGDVVVTDSLAFGEEHPDFAVRLDKPRRASSRAAAEQDAPDDPGPAAAEAEQESD